MAEVLLDVSPLPPPEPLEQILNTLATLSPGDQLRVIHRRQPFPLYDLLSQMGYIWETEERADGRFEILIRPAKADPC